MPELDPSPESAGVAGASGTMTQGNWVNNPGAYSVICCSRVVSSSWVTAVRLCGVQDSHQADAEFRGVRAEFRGGKMFSPRHRIRRKLPRPSHHGSMQGRSDRCWASPRRAAPGVHHVSAGGGATNNVKGAIIKVETPGRQDARMDARKG